VRGKSVHASVSVSLPSSALSEGGGRGGVRLIGGAAAAILPVWPVVGEGRGGARVLQGAAAKAKRRGKDDSRNSVMGAHSDVGAGELTQDAGLQEDFSLPHGGDTVIHVCMYIYIYTLCI